MNNIILLAPPASGKGTQANILKERLNLIHISTGDLLRKAASKDDEFGRNLSQILSTGALVSDDIVVELLKNELLSNKDSNGFIFDGFPRTVNQAIILDKMLEENDMKINNVFELDVNYDILLKRITGRLTCKNCGEIYNIYDENMKPKIENICDKCNHDLTKRSDDNEESFKVRYQEYLEKTEPLISYYENKGNLVKIDATRNIEDIFNDILSHIKEND